MTVFHLIYTIFNNFFQLIDIALTRIIYLYELIISHNENIHNRNLLLQSALTLGLFIYVVYAHARNLRPSSAATRGGGTNSYCSYCWRQVRAEYEVRWPRYYGLLPTAKLRVWEDEWETVYRLSLDVA